MYLTKKELTNLLHGVFNLTIHVARVHGAERWTVSELNDTEKSITDYVITQYKKEKRGQKCEK